MQIDSSGDQFAGIARSLSDTVGVTATLENVTSTALAIIDSCDHAGISLVAKGREIRTVAPIDDVIARADLLQYAVAITAAQQHADADSTLVNRAVIGQAEGMLMQALAIDPTRPSLSWSVSHRRNTTLHLIAADIVNRGIRPDLFT